MTSAGRRARTSTDRDSRRDPAVEAELKQHERERLFRFVMPMIASGLGVSALYGWLALSSGLSPFWYGPALAGAGALACSAGYALRLREVRSADAPTSRHYAWLYLGAVLIAAGVLVPPYALT